MACCTIFCTSFLCSKILQLNIKCFIGICLWTIPKKEEIFFQIKLEKLPKTKIWWMSFIPGVLQQEQWAGFTPKVVILSWVGSFALSALQTRKETLKGICFCRMKELRLALIPFFLINSQADELVNFTFSVAFQIASYLTPSWYWIRVPNFRGIRLRDTFCLRRVSFHLPAFRKKDTRVLLSLLIHCDDEIDDPPLSSYTTRRSCSQSYISIESVPLQPSCLSSQSSKLKIGHFFCTGFAL